MKPLFNQAYGSHFEKELIADINRVGTVMDVSEGQDLIRPGQYIKSIPLLLSGSIKIMRPDDDGEELLLYHLEKGDTCAMMMTCCMGDIKSEIHAVAETPVKILMIPIDNMEEWSSKYKTWRNFVFESYHKRMMEMLDSIDTIAFHNLEERLEHYLENKVSLTNSKHLYTTHKEIAQDLHTSRVVISRLLKKMENSHKLKLHRSFIEVL
ncbi:Crp/Fnr family transcriptional regulator [Marinirhabdus gelatinilytica]|uniref:CRP/FNR family transcriptional regulator n=1 Tax=Marinirhabdus gelatinilytica TaxID=1703343 RepID=A0A370QGE3_9FLAO|nr:Crp/Fnr family transcriptional regulator [Marinirhabdus gelatinilytica]RDK87359.1 CRP/FNR family transcriptional regulator [Marinirhabdus gelatinilytica]